MTAELLQHKRSGLWYRPDTYDRAIIGERCTYARCVVPRADDVLLDVGANIGSVSWTWLNVGASVVAFEPEPLNFRLLKRNLAQFDQARAITVEAAVGGLNCPPERSLWLTRGNNHGIHSTVRRRGRDELRVRCLPLDGMWAAYEPTVVKIDIEGGEYELMPVLADLPATVRAIMIELHLTRSDWRQATAQTLIDVIEAQNLVTVRAPRIGPSNWTTFGAWMRPEEGITDVRAREQPRRAVPPVQRPRSASGDVHDPAGAAKAPWE